MGCCYSKSKKRSKKRQEDNQSSDAPKGDSKNSATTIIGDGEKGNATWDKEERIIGYTALWDYEASNLAELSFFEGNTFVQVGDKCDAGPDWLFVMRTAESGWIYGSIWRKPDEPDERLKRMGILGYIPRNYVAAVGSAESEPSYAGHLTRKKAEKLLGRRPNGTFVIYYSGLKQLTLSVSYKRRVEHYPIKTCVDELGSRVFFVDGGSKYDDMRQMIDFFRDEQPNLCCRLTKSLPKSPPPPKYDLPAEIQERWREIPREQLHKDEKIGEFCTSVTYKGTWMSQSSQANLQVAIKELKNWPFEDSKSTDLLTEAIVLKNLRHENIVRLVGIVTDQIPLVIVTEYVKDGSLYGYLRNPKRGFIPHYEVIDICRQIANGMYYLERMKVIHKSLHIRNVLIHKDRVIYHVKLADFGFAMAFKGQIEQEDSAIDYDPLWNNERNEYTSDTDVKDFGLLLYVIYTSAMDPCISEDERRDRVLELKEKIVIPRNMPVKLYSLMQTCFADEGQRPNFGKILDYLTKYCEEFGASPSHEGL